MGLITTEEIRASTATDAFELIQASRPGWLRLRGTQSIRGTQDDSDRGEIIVYVNQSRLGGISELRNMPIGGITSVEFVDAATATQRWGTGHSYGAIVISTAARPR